MIDWWFGRWRKITGKPVPVNEVAVHTPVHPEPPSALPLKPLAEPVDRDGAVWLDGAGNVRVTNPQGPSGRFPVLSVPVGDAVTVLVNGEQVMDDRPVEESDHIVVRANPRSPHAQVRVDRSPDDMEASLSVQYQPGERRVLQPTGPGLRLELTTVSFPIDPPRVTVTQIRTELARAGVSAGIVGTAEIQTFLATGASGQMVVARGIEPRPGAGSVQWADERPPDGSWEVEPGTILGSRRPDPARPGLTVTGKPVQGQPIAPGREIRLGAGVTLMTHGTKLVAARRGFVIQDDGVMDVVSKHTLAEITSAREPLVLDADVVVRGSIVRRTVVVTGNLVVLGEVREAELVVGGALEVRSAMSDAALFLGYGRFAQKRAEHHVGRLVDALYDLEITAEQLIKEGGRSLADRFPALLQQVVTTKFTDIRESLDWFTQAFAWPSLTWSDALTRSVRELTDRLDQGKIESMAELLALRTELEYLELDHMVLERPIGRKPMETVLGDVRRSQIDGLGGITVDSVFSSRVAVDELRIKGAAVGGFLSARRHLRARQLGNDSAIETSVEVVQADGHIDAAEAFPGVALVVGHERRILEQWERAVSFGTKGGDKG